MRDIANKKESIIVITGAAGFIGSCLTGYLNEQGYNNLILVDEFDEEKKELNLLHKNFSVRVERENFFEWLQKEVPVIDFVFHLGARTDTTEFDYTVHQHLNVEYSQKMWKYCCAFNIPLVYASSAATYGDGMQGYDDDHDLLENLRPLNPYGESKNEFDKWVLEQKSKPLFWAGLKFFNVYGPNEYHKERMASMIFHSYNQIMQHGSVKLFRSHKEGFRDGEQMRDFIYVKDILKVCYWLLTNYSTITPAIYNLGTGKARTYNDLVKSTFAGLNQADGQIDYIDMPTDIRDRYQYFTEAKMHKLVNAGYHQQFYSLEDGVTDYVKNYLSANRFY